MNTEIDQFPITLLRATGLVCSDLIEVLGVILANHNPECTDPECLARTERLKIRQGRAAHVLDIVTGLLKASKEDQE